MGSEGDFAYEDRLEDGEGYALCSWCNTSEFGSRHCLACKMIPSPHAKRRDKSAQGRTGGIADFGPEPIHNTTPDSPTFFLGQRVGALAHERKRKRHQIAASDAKRAARPGKYGRGFPTKVRSWRTRCTRVHQASPQATGRAMEATPPLARERFCGTYWSAQSP